MLKRLFFRTIMMFVMFVGIGSYFAYMKGHSPLELLDKLRNAQATQSALGSLETLAPLANQGEANDGTQVLKAGKTTVYKWQDETGQWHYGQSAPSDANDVQALVINPNQNVIAGIAVPAAGDDDDKATATTESDAAAATGNKPAGKGKSKNDAPPAGELPDNPYSPEAIKKLFEDAKSLQSTLDARAAGQGAKTP